MAEVEPHLEDFGQQGGVPGDLPYGYPQLEERVERHNCIRCKNIPEGVEVIPSGGAGPAVVGGHEDGGRDGEAEGGQAQEEGEVVEPPELLLRKGGLELRPGAEVEAKWGWRGVAVAGGLVGSHFAGGAEERTGKHSRG